MSAQPDSSGTDSTMFARISADDQVLYANAALSRYVGMAKEEVQGMALEDLLARVGGDLRNAFTRQARSGSMNEIATDANGRTFEVSRTYDGAVLDVVLTEITDSRSAVVRFGESFSLPAESLTDDEVRSVWRPERRILTILQARLCGLDELAGHLAPIEGRLLVNLFVEEWSSAIRDSGGTTGSLDAGQVEGIFGAPRYYRDHPLRALRAAMDAFQTLGRLRTNLHRAGKELPPLACGIASGEVLLASLSSSGVNRLTVSGACSALADQLCRIARPGEILISQFALSSLLGCLPSGWDAIRAETEDPPDLSGISWQGDEIGALPENLQRHVYLLGPGVEHNSDATEFYMEYLYTVRAQGFNTPVPVLRVVRPERTGVEIELSEDNVVTSAPVQVLGKYKLHRVVGQGGMGKVWRGEDRFGNIVAIKVLNSAETAGEDTVRRFEREAEIMSRLPHRNICRVFETNIYEGIQFIAMEYVEGLTLADLLYEEMTAEGASRVTADDLPSLIKKLCEARSRIVESGNQPTAETGQRPKINRILPLSASLTLFSKVCEGVQFAHEHGILHRDLKPGNVLVRQDGEPLVADFGLAKLEGDDISLSISGHVVGTLENMAPEQAESSKDVDERADVYSLGTILYMLLTGRRHFHPSGNIVADAQTLKNHEPLRPRHWNPKVDSDLELIVLKALRPNPEERYRTVAALKADLERYRRGEMISARPVTALELTRKLIARNRAVSAVVGVSLFLLAVLTLFSFREINERRIDAERALQVAEEAAELAEVARMDAEEHMRLAEKRRLEAEQALLQVEAARTDAERVAVEKDEAMKETEGERTARIAIEERAKALEEELAVLRAAVSETKEEPAVSVQEFGRVPDAKEPELAEARPKTDWEEPMRPDFEEFPVAEFGFDEEDGPPEPTGDPLRNAKAILFDSLSPFALRALRENLPEVRNRVLQGVHYSSLAVLFDPRNPEAWLLKGRFHLAMHEFDQARNAFSQAIEALQNGAGNTHLLGVAESLGFLSEKAAGMVAEQGELGEEIAGELKRSEFREDYATADLLQIPFWRELGTASERPPTLGETLLVLRNDNPMARPHIEIEGDPAWPRLRISEAEGLENLDSLRNLSVQELVLRGVPMVDWEILGSMRMEKLTVENSSTTGPPAMAASQFARLQRASFRDSNIDSLSFLSSAGNLKSLDIANTKVTDLSPLQTRSLRHLNIEGLTITNLLVLSRFPLESLVIDIATASDSSRIHFLRFHRTLKSLRTPQDPQNQPLSEFWRKSSAGDYQTSSQEIVDTTEPANAN